MEILNTVLVVFQNMNTTTWLQVYHEYLRFDQYIFETYKYLLMKRKKGNQETRKQKS